MKIPLLVLAVLAIVGGYLKQPLFALLHSALPATIESHAGGFTETGSEAVAGLLFLLGLYLAYVFHLQKRSLSDSLVANPLGHALDQWWFAGWGFDWIYDKAFVQPFLWILTSTRAILSTHSISESGAWLSLYRWLSSTETGRVRWYATAMAAGAVLFIAMVLFL